MQTTTAIARQITTVSADIALLTFKAHFFACIGSRMAECAYGAVNWNRSAEPDTDDLAYVEEGFGCALTALELSWFKEGFAAEYAFCAALERGCEIAD